MVFGIYFLLNNLLRLIFPIGGATSVSLVIPGLTLRLYWLPYFVVAAVVVILAHELAHGVIARLEEIPVLSTGILAAVVLFGAFESPTRKSLRRLLYSRGFACCLLALPQTWSRLYLYSCCLAGCLHLQLAF